MAAIWAYVSDVLLEGIGIALAFWIITYLTLESTSLAGALRAGLASEAVGNLPYLAGIGAMEPPSIIMTLVGAALFVRIILRVGELTLIKVLLGLLMSYFFLVALVACAPV